MKKPSKFTIDRAKRTLVGRFVCRLLGEQTGAVLMEYVVLGVLIVAAAVAMVLAFGKGIRTQFSAMLEAILGRTGKVTERTGQGYSDADADIPAAQTYGTDVSGKGE